MYLSKLNPKCDRLFQRPLFLANGQRASIWYFASPIGKDKIDNMTLDISQQAQTRYGYTNHCVRATLVTTLAAEGVADRRILAITVHKNVQSLQSDSRPSEQQQQSMASLLDKLALPVPTSPATS
eukprot:scpid98822/ scgid20284/ 